MNEPDEPLPPDAPAPESSSESEPESLLPETAPPESEAALPLPQDEETPAGGDDGGETGSFADILLDGLAGGPLTGYRLCREVERVFPGLLCERDGFVYPVLLELWREGLIETEWVDLPQGRRRLYRVAGSPDAVHAPAVTPAPSRQQVWTDPRGRRTGPGGPSTPSQDPDDEPLRRRARQATRTLEFAPRLHEETRMDVLNHLLDAAASYRALGLTPQDARDHAVKDLGDPWKIRTDLWRAARGKRTVIFPRNLREHVLGVAVYDVKILLFILAAILFVRMQVVTAYHIPTKSMEPTLHGDRKNGDRILVNKMASPPERFDIVVFDGWGSDRKNFVKRTVGMPDERLELFGGNLYVNGELHRKDDDHYEWMLFPVYVFEDEVVLSERIAEEEGVPASEILLDNLKDRWATGGGIWDLVDRRSKEDGTVGFRGGPDPQAQETEDVELIFDERITDGVYEKVLAESGGGRVDVADVRMEAGVTLLGPGARAGIRLRRGDRTFEAVLSESTVDMSVDGVVVESVSGDYGDRTVDVRFSQVDLVLRLEIDGQTVARHDLPAPDRHPSGNLRGEVSLIVPAGKARFEPRNLERDVHWTSGPEDGASHPVDLGPDEYYMLGDNSSNSQDSRAKGPVHTSRLVGKPMVVIWPVDRWRIVR